MHQGTPRIPMQADGFKGETELRDGYHRDEKEALGQEALPWVNDICLSPLARPKLDEGSVLLLHRTLGDKDASRYVQYQRPALSLSHQQSSPPQPSCLMSKPL